MLSKLLAHVRHNVVAYVALFVALGGTAYAAKPLITGADVQDGTLNSADLRDRGSTSYPGPSIQGTDLEANTLTGSEIDESTLGKVPDADKLDGLNSTAFGSGAMMGRMVGQVDLPDQFWLAPSGNSEPNRSGVNGAAQLSPNSDIVARDLSVRATVNFAGGDYAMTVTLVTEAGPTPLSCSLTAVGVASCNSGTATATIPAGSPVALEFLLLGNSITTVSDLQFGWRATTP